MSAIIIAVILLLIVVSGSVTSFYGRLNVLDGEYKEGSLSLAEACADQALLELAVDPSYTGNATTTVAGERCYVGPITGTTQKSFKTRGIYHNSYTALAIVIDANTLAVVSWQETPTF